MRSVETIRYRAALEVSRRSRLTGVVALLDALARETPLSAADHQFYFMAWRAAGVLRAAPGDLVAGRSTSVPTS